MAEQMNLRWDEANNISSIIREGWRLPSKEELNEVYLYKEKLNINCEGAYWGSSETEYGKIQRNTLSF